MGLANSLLPAQRGALFLVLILLGLGSSQLTIAIQVHLRSRLIDVIRNPEAVIALERTHRRLLEDGGTPMADARWGILKSSQQWIVAAPSVTDKLLRAVAQVACSSGGRITALVPDTGILVAGPPGMAEALGSMEGVGGVSALLPEHKLAPEWKEVLEAREQDVVEGSGSSISRPFPIYLSRPSRSGGSLLHFADVSLAPRLPRPWLDAADVTGSADEQATMRACRARDIDEASAEAAAAEWLPRLQSRFGGEVTVEKTGDSTVRVSLPGESLMEGLSWLASQPASQWVSTSGRPLLYNYQAVTIDQTGESATSLPPDLFPFGQPNSPGSLRPVWDAGITGRGQVVGCADSGLDLDSCFMGGMTFSDFQEDTLNSISLHGGNGKVKGYRVFGGDKVDANGHGTHVVGTILGNPSGTSFAEHAGMAKDAQVVFTDMGIGEAGALSPPADLGRYFSWGWGLGARVFSESWGTSQNSYDILAETLDRFAYENPDHLAAVAAGNFGGLDDAGNDKDATVGSPATAKNSISVGATLSPLIDGFANQRALEKAGRIYRLRVTTEFIFFGSTEFDNDYSVQLAYFGPAEIPSEFIGIAKPVAVTFPNDACTALSNKEHVNQKVVLISSGGICDNVEKVQNAQNAGAVMAIIINNSTDGHFKMFADSEGRSLSITIPSASMPRITGKRIWSLVLGVGNIATIRLDNALQIPEIRERHLAPYSSVGPTADGRIKPDITAPGSIRSAKSDGDPNSRQCTVTDKRGTSMATPQVGGGAALIRQYFMEGFYPTKERTANHAYEPSGALIKAVMMVSTKDMDGLQSSDNPNLDGVPLEPPPSNRQGFGRMHMRGIPIKGTKDGDRYSLQVVDRVPIAEGEKHRYCIRVDPMEATGRIRAVLTWHDPPSMTGAGKVLVNDLDLQMDVQELNGYPILGNGGAPGLDDLGPDNLNNAELVSFYASPGLVAITVHGRKVPMPQNYSLAVFGEISGQLESENNPVRLSTGQQSETCVVVSPEIIIKPEHPTNNRFPMFTYGTSSGNTEILAKFDCKLKCAEGTCMQSRALHDWIDCTGGTMPYSDLDDGTYAFSLAFPSEHDAPKVHVFTVDTVRPVTSITPTTPIVVTDGTAVFELHADDPFGSTFRCRLIGANDLPLTASQAASVTGIHTTPTFEPCDEQVEIKDLPLGLWKLQARAIDTAGNRELLFASAYVLQTGDVNRVYAELTRVPRSHINTTEVDFEFALVAGTYSSSQGQAGLQCKQDEMGGNGAWATAQNWYPCRSPERLVGLGDGKYRFSVRSGDAMGVFTPPAFATSLFEVDTAPPTVTIKPPSKVDTSLVSSFELTSSEADTGFLCALLPQSYFGNRDINAASVETGVASVAFLKRPANEEGLVESDPRLSLHGWTACTSPRLYSLPGSDYLFAAKATDQAGNRGGVKWWTWKVDRRAVTETNMTVNILGKEFSDTEFTSQVPRVPYPNTDMPEGFFVSNKVQMKFDFEFPGFQISKAICRLTKIKYELDKGLLGQWATEDSSYELCASGVNYTASLGFFLFKVIAITGPSAGSIELSSQNVVVAVDRRPPVAAILSNFTGQQWPSAFQASFDLQDIGESFSPAKAFCMLSRLPENTTDGDLDRSSNVTAPVIMSGLTKAEVGSLGVDQVVVRYSTGDFVSGENGILLGLWVPCLKFARYTGVPEGKYQFRLYARDMAGNEAQQLSSKMIAVNATLRVPAWAQEFESESRPWWHWLVVALAGGLFLTVVVLLVVCLCKCCCEKDEEPPEERPQSSYESSKSVAANTA